MAALDRFHCINYRELLSVVQVARSLIHLAKNKTNQQNVLKLFLEFCDFVEPLLLQTSPPAPAIH